MLRFHPHISASPVALVGLQDTSLPLKAPKPKKHPRFISFPYAVCTTNSQVLLAHPSQYYSNLIMFPQSLWALQESPYVSSMISNFFPIQTVIRGIFKPYLNLTMLALCLKSVSLRTKQLTPCMVYDPTWPKPCLLPCPPPATTAFYLLRTHQPLVSQDLLN